MVETAFFLFCIIVQHLQIHEMKGKFPMSFDGFTLRLWFMHLFNLNLNLDFFLFILKCKLNQVFSNLCISRWVDRSRTLRVYLAENSDSCILISVAETAKLDKGDFCSHWIISCSCKFFPRKGYTERLNKADNVDNRLLICLSLVERFERRNK